MFIKSTRNRRLGWGGEILAAALLLTRGYWPVAWSYKHPAAEIDLICRRGRDLLLVEVKTRKTWAAHDNALSHHQNQRQETVKSDFQTKHPEHHVRRAVVSLTQQYPFMRLTYL